MKCVLVFHTLCYLALSSILFATRIFSNTIIENGNRDKNYSIEIATGLSEICKGLVTNYLTIVAPNNTNITDIDEFLKKMHRSDIKTSIFFDIEDFLQYIEQNYMESIETTSLIFSKPELLINELHSRNLGHRLNLFMFFWNLRAIPKVHNWNLREPLRVVIITRPREKVFRVFYNQAEPSGKGPLKIVNWYDGENLGLNATPLFKIASKVYQNFKGRIFYIPVIHSPPWHFVEYYNETSNETINDLSYSDAFQQGFFKVTGGRDYNLLMVLSSKMNFQFDYLDLLERSQGSINLVDNLNFTGGLGMLQRREADFFLGDIAITWERRKAVEFSFFTLADSGAFVTHAPKRLNEALALVRPFRWEVWPPLILTIGVSGPLFYFIIAAPFWWRTYGKHKKIRMPTGKLKQSNQIKRYLDRVSCIESNLKIQFSQLNRMRYVPRARHPYHITYFRINYPKKHFKSRDESEPIPKDLLNRCIWFTITLFLRQSCTEPYSGHRARFLCAILWLAATYVLGDVYSAQLTSQLARPAREAPINTLQKLEIAMRFKNYQLLVERQSSSFGILENGTEIFKRLFHLMQHQTKYSTKHLQNESNLVSSVEEGINLIKHGSPKAVLGGRETLYYNMKRHGIQNFQLSEKLYTRYSAVAVQAGCPFLGSLNDVLMHLFEAGILEKMTNAEYEKMLESSQRQSSDGELNTNGNQKTFQHVAEQKLQPINLRMLQGAFFVLAFGYFMAGIILICEIQSKKPQLKCTKQLQRYFKVFYGNFQKFIAILKNKIFDQN